MSKTELDAMVEEVEGDDALETEEVDNIVTSESPKWSEHVLDQMDDSELREGNPTVDGLRRVTERIYGEIISSTSDVIKADERACTIKHTLQIQKYSTGATITVDGCIDVRYQNVPHPFNQHLVATADTRAEGKALRRALKLRVITAEEMQNTSEDDILAAEENITDQQILAINQMCKRLDIDLVGIVKNTCANVESIRNVNNLQGRMLLSSLSEYQRKTSSITDDIKGYNSEWRENFDSGGEK
tara:strand:- start:19441 stop:20172 length:732 start_codon:yes stop_codon:yes gene_type:complete